MSLRRRACVQRRIDRAVAVEVSAGRFPAGDDLRELEVRTEAAFLLAGLASNDPETVYVVGCMAEFELGGAVSGYEVRAREERTIARPDAQVTVVVASGVTCEHALARLDQIRAYLAELPCGSVLATDDPCLDRPTDPVARLDGARAIVLGELKD